jgi:hypothetical protein
VAFTEDNVEEVDSEEEEIEDEEDEEEFLTSQYLM